MPPEDVPPWDLPPSEELMQAPYLPEEENLSEASEPAVREIPAQPKEAPAEKPVEPETPKEEDPKMQELQQIWQQVFEKAVSRRASLKLLANDIRALEEGPDSFTVSVTSSLKRNMLLQNGELFEESLEEVTGKKLKLKAELGARPQDREKQMQNTLSQLEELLGPGKLTVKE